MKDFIKNPPSPSELMNWKRSPSINPRNKKSLLLKNNKFSKAYYTLKGCYDEVFTSGFDIFDSIDERDPVSLEYFYKKNIDKDSGIISYKLLYKDISNLTLYEEIDGDNIKIRCFEKESLSSLKTYKINEHPVSKIKIPDHIFDKVTKTKVNRDKLSVKERALQVFQIFSNISIFIDYTLFLNLNKNQLLKLNYEIRDFYYQNFSDEDRQLLEYEKLKEKSDESLDSSNLNSENRKKFFNLDSSSSEMKSKDIQYIQYYLLDQIELLIDCKIDKLKYMTNYIALAGLSLVIDEVKESYENFLFNFT